VELTFIFDGYFSNHSSPLLFVLDGYLFSSVPDDDGGLPQRSTFFKTGGGKKIEHADFEEEDEESILVAIKAFICGIV
jgi:hypothetical protein